jgi:putative ABC transport system permease protein
MWYAAIRDLIWRRRRYAISIAGTALVFGVSLAVTGISDAFPAELDRTFDSLGATSFVIPDDTSGPFTGSHPFDPAELPDGVDPMAYLVQTANPIEPEMVAVVGLPSGDAEPTVMDGAQLAAPGDALVDADSSFAVGSTVELAGRQFDVTGRVDGMSLHAGMPIVVVPLESFQETLLGGLPMVTGGIARGPVEEIPDGFHVVDLPTAREDTLRILGDAAATITMIKVLLWVVAGLIVGSVMYLSAVERTRDFAVFKAIGAPTRAMAGGVALQAAVLATAASVLGIALAFLMAPFFPMRVQLSTTSVIVLPAIGLGIGLVAAVFALRRAVSVDPALAFGGAT